MEKENIIDIDDIINEILESRDEAHQMIDVLVIGLNERIREKLNNVE